MRVWDIHPGYLDRSLLLAELGDLRRVRDIVGRHSPGDGIHPEAGRWLGCGGALAQRCRVLVAEMVLRGEVETAPATPCAGRWPGEYIDAPGEQFAALAGMYAAGDGGASARIPLPRTAHELWAQHKYSVLARNQAAYRALGRRVAALRGRAGFSDLALELVEWLRKPPRSGDLANAVQHMCGYSPGRGSFESLGAAAALAAIQASARDGRGSGYLATQTALSDLAAWPGAG